MKPYISLGFYKPKVWNAREIGQHLVSLTRRAGFIPHDDPNHGPLALKGRAWHSQALHAEVRRRTCQNAQGEDWHYDGDTTPGSKPDCWIILWASNTPTWIKWRVCHCYSCAGSNLGCVHEEIFKPGSYEVVALRNIECLHRRPPNCPRIRWVFRQRAQRP